MQDVDSVLSRASTAHTQLQSFVELALQGLGWAREALRIHNLMARDSKLAPLPMWKDEHEARAQRAAAFATEQDGQGFRYLWSLATVQLWSIAEVMVDHVVIQLLHHADAIPDDSVVRRLEGPLLPFVGASHDERAEQLVGLLKEKLRPGLKPGVGRFEALLEPFGLGGAYPDNVRRTLLELSQVRNLVVHQNGLVDRRFQAACPWFTASLGEPLQLVSNHFVMYRLCVDWMILEIGLRLMRRDGLTAPRDQTSLKQEVEARLDNLVKTRPRSDSPDEQPPNDR